MDRYIAFDVETPNRFNSRMSAIGIAVVEDGRIVDTFTGIDSEAVAGAPTFPELWERIEPLMSSGILVAHNAPFDMGVLKKCLQSYGIAWRPQVRGLCTVLMGRRLLPGISHRLGDMCAYYGIDLNHHRADSDSMACAQILLRYMESGADVARFIRTYTLY